MAEKLVWKAVEKRRLPRLNLIAKHGLTDEQLAVMVDAAWPDEDYETGMRVLGAFVFVQRERVASAQRTERWARLMSVYDQPRTRTPPGGINLSGD